MSSTLKRILFDSFKFETITDWSAFIVPAVFSIGLLAITILFYLIGAWFLWFVAFPVAVYFCFKKLYSVTRPLMKTDQVKDFDTQQTFERYFLFYLCVASFLPSFLGFCVINSSLTEGMTTNFIVGFIVTAILCALTSVLSRAGLIYTLKETDRVIKRQIELTKLAESKKRSRELEEQAEQKPV